MLVSKIISLKVVSIWDKKFEGIVENALFDKKNNKDMNVGLCNDFMRRCIDKCYDKLKKMYFSVILE